MLNQIGDACPEDVAILEECKTRLHNLGEVVYERQKELAAEARLTPYQLRGVSEGCFCKC